MIGWALRLLLLRFARRAGPVGPLALLGGPVPRLLLLLLAVRALRPGARPPGAAGLRAFPAPPVALRGRRPTP